VKAEAWNGICTRRTGHESCCGVSEGTEMCRTVGSESEVRWDDALEDFSPTAARRVLGWQMQLLVVAGAP
jgi:hypothetical protein